MRKRLVIAASIAIVLSCQCVFGLDSADSVRTSLPEAVTGRVLPVDSRIGQVCDPGQSLAHEILFAALSKEYSVEWIETYLDEGVRSALVRLYGSWLSETLPAEGVLMSVSHENADGSIGIDVRVGDRCMAFILSGDRIIAMRSLD